MGIHDSQKKEKASIDNFTEYGETVEMNDIITLDDEYGNAVQYQFLDLVKYNEKEYIVLLPLDDYQSGKVVILRIEGEGENESYVTLDSIEEATHVYEAFKKAVYSNE